jgi:hypothetical protein
MKNYNLLTIVLNLGKLTRNWWVFNLEKSSDINCYKSIS